MTDLQTRKLRFGFADYDVPFVWNEVNPAFSCATNALTFFAIGFEKMICAAVTEALPLIADPTVAAEARAFMHQEGQHTLGHRQHAKALIKRYPALKATFDTAIGMFDELTATKPLKYRLAYTADVEATFTPSFKLMLDNADTLFKPGDDRVASLFLWHTVEEVEHRSSALLVYDAAVADPWYRTRVAPSIFAHVGAVMTAINNSFNELIPLKERKVDAMWADGTRRWKKALSQRFSSFNFPDYGPCDGAYTHIPRRQQLAAAYGCVRSQMPGHDPAHAKLPALATEWLARYDAGYDVTRWYTSAQSRTS
ncbi:metal-dependent hydrolase [Mycobacterium sp. CBMA 234]|uniref:metal-dependent hydrolase n=1 Tax=Mycolicibacterium sp. CBMA 234 TaxID=1918495 RepID=UPI001391BC21|nr:metal-dependent hydrolase [Mycolicibacterium sp. CBMA 234]MUL63433.1 metal-dependent hydrolase [Mycolicibacterium sp. CBMA 234]